MEDTTDSTTPKIASLLVRLQKLNHEVTKNINQIVKRLDTFDPPLELLPAKENIVDRKAEKEHHKKRWKIEVKEVIDNYLSYEELK